MLKSVSRFTLFFCSALALCGFAHADTVHSSFNFLIGTGDFYNGNGLFVECQGYASSCTQSASASTSGTYNLFNSSLGTLKGVTLTLTSTYPLGMELLSFGGHSTLSGSSDYNVGGYFSGTIAAQGYTCDGFCDMYPSPNGTIDNVLDGTYSVADANLASFIGSGTANMSITQSATLTGSSENSYTFRIRTNELFTQGWRGTVDVAYDYTPVAAPVPEPSSALLMLGGLPMLAALVRKKLHR